MKTDVRRFNSKAVAEFHLFQAIALSDFVTERSANLFTALKINRSFFTLDPDSCPSYPSYLEAKQKIVSMKVINVCAESAVRLAIDFNSALTHDETEHQLVLQIVEYHQSLKTNPSKQNYR